MSFVSILAVVVSIIAIIAASAATLALAFSSGNSHFQKKEYDLKDKWEEKSLLFSATDEIPVARSIYAKPDDFIEESSHVIGGLVDGSR